MTNDFTKGAEAMREACARECEEFRKYQILIRDAAATIGAKNRMDDCIQTTDRLTAQIRAIDVGAIQKASSSPDN